MLALLGPVFTDGENIILNTEETPQQEWIFPQWINDILLEKQI